VKTRESRIETKQAYENLDDILSVPGLGGVFVGPNDLGISFGYAPTSSPKGAVLGVIKEIARKTRAKNLVAGIFCVDVETARYFLLHAFKKNERLTIMANNCREMQSLGFNYVSIGTDSGLLLDAAKKAVKAAKL